MDFEIAHINVSTQSEEQKRQVLDAIAEKTSREADEGVSGCPWEDDKPIVDWHTDSYPFVCVTMLSDCTEMLGGETALRTGTGEIMRVRGPQQVGTFRDDKQLRMDADSILRRATLSYFRVATSNTKL
jgi:hypothetical protein